MFDSLGRTPENYPARIKNFLVARGRPYTFSNKRIQGNSPICGHYCVDYLNAKPSGLTLNQYLNQFDKDLLENDVKVLNHLGVNHLDGALQN